MNPEDPAASVERPYQDLFARLYHRVIDDERIGKLGLAAYVALARFADFNAGTAEVRRTVLAKKARLSVRSLDSGLAELVNCRYLEIDRVQNADGSYSASKYRLLDTAIAQAVVRNGVAQEMRQGGSAGDAPPPHAGPARGVVQAVREGGAGAAHQEQETTNKRHKNEKAAQLPLVGGDAAPDVPTVNQRANALAKRYVDLVPMSKFPAVMGICKKAIGTALYADEEISCALVRIAQEGRPLTVDVLRIELEGLTPARVAAAGGSRTEVRVQAGMDVARRMAEREASGQ